MNDKRIAYFVSHHGFGHAARASAVMQAIHSLRPDIEFELFTRAPRWFFDMSLTFRYGYQEITTDVGLIQQSPLEEDLPATIRKLANFLPFPDKLEHPIVHQLIKSQFDLCICDISPFGLAASHTAGIPAVLIENFTWDWIYSGYLAECPGFNRFIPQFTKTFQNADIHIQTEPVTQRSNKADLITNPVARKPRLSIIETRQLLNIPAQAPVIMITMGGFEVDYSFIEQLTVNKNVWFVIPGGAQKEVEYHPNLVLLPHHSDFYHPDLINAADAVISKAGYSTLSEAYLAGIPFGYVSRDRFRESPILSAFIQQNMHGIEINGETFQSGSWINSVSYLLDLGRRKSTGENGADQAAKFIVNILN